MRLHWVFAVVTSVALVPVAWAAGQGSGAAGVKPVIAKQTGRLFVDHRRAQCDAICTEMHSDEPALLDQCTTRCAYQMEIQTVYLDCIRDAPSDAVKTTCRETFRDARDAAE